MLAQPKTISGSMASRDLPKQTTSIGLSTRFNGTLSHARAVRVVSSFEGNLSALSLVGEPGSTIKAKVKCEDFTLGGSFQGEILASGTASISETAVCSGSVVAALLSIKPGAEVDCNFEVTPRSLSSLDIFSISNEHFHRLAHETRS